MSYCEGVLQAVERRASGRRVARVGVRAGSLHRIVPEAFEQSFQLVAAGGVADGATTEVLVVPAQVHCRECGADTTSDTVPACARCGSFDVDVTGGDELVLEWLEFRAAGEPLDRPDAMLSDHSHADESAHQHHLTEGR